MEPREAKSVDRIVFLIPWIRKVSTVQRFGAQRAKQCILYYVFDLKLELPVRGRQGWAGQGRAGQGWVGLGRADFDLKL